jgi:hypothetical protein
MAGSLSVASVAVSSTKVAVVDFGEVGRSAVCINSFAIISCKKFFNYFFNEAARTSNI